ncbi:universal stress protein [Bacillus sp. JCM 19041]|uniref:universal stress protein n=1 Tax=Bacillus sp. JCM 19041 TaxID=1460637 RepID=UPI000A41149C
METAFSSGNPRIQVAKELTKENEADLLITSATGRNRMDRFFTGSVAEAAMRHSPCDYLIVKGYEDSSSRYKNIVVGIDGSTQSENAVREAATLAKEHGANLTIVYVLPVSSYQGVATSSPELMEGREREKIKGMLAANKKQAEEIGAMNVKTEFLHGSPREKFSTGLSKTIEPDLIVIGSTGTNMVTRFMIGSVAEAAMRHAPCDVLTVK